MSPKFKCSECNMDLSLDDVLTHTCNIATAMVVPDAIGEIVGWRAWAVYGEREDVRLGSITHSKYRWPPRTFMLAECKTHSLEEVPGERCTCGLYAAKTREHLLSMSYHRYEEDSSDVIIGEVAMSGRVITGTQGWRAQKARIQKLYVPYERWQLVNPLKEVYGVEVELSNTLAIPEVIQP